MSRSDKRLWAALAVLLSVVTLAADFALARFCSGRCGFLDALSDEYWVPSAIYDHDLPRASDRQAIWLGRKYRLITNDLGFKDAAPRAVPLAPSGRRILLIGDSFTEGIGVPYAETFAGLLAAELAPRGAELLNAGVFSYYPLIYYLKTRHLVETVGLRFDEMVVMIDISDIPDEARSDFPDAAGGLDYYRNHGWRRRTLAALKENSLILRLADHLKDLFEYWRSGQSRGAGRTDLTLSAWTFRPDEREKVGSPGLARAAESMSKLAAFLRERRIALTVAVYPWPDQIARREMPSIQSSFWREWAAKEGAGFVDLFPEFIDAQPAERTIERYFIERDVHWNAAGHAKVARALAPYLVK